MVNYNPPESTTAYYWVFFEGSDNGVERCLFAQKSHMGPLVGEAIRTGGELGDDGAFFTIGKTGT